MGVIPVRKPSARVLEAVARAQPAFGGPVYSSLRRASAHTGSVVGACPLTVVDRERPATA